MNRTPVADWQQLSALYELADALDDASLGDWLARLQAQAHPLLPQLRQMLDARAQIEHNGFLASAPQLPRTTSARGDAARAPDPPVIEWTDGSRIGPYRLLRHLGAGGMAEVWLAQRDDGAFQRTVAIKLLFRHAGSSQRDSFAQRFTRERDILASLDHPNIAGLHDAGVTSTGQPWLALEYVEGEPLTTWCDAQRLSVAARVRLFCQVLLAVQHAHANLVIHRDLKPANILVTPQGEVRLLDFGIAKLMEAESGATSETELTRQAGRPMTLLYASPEQIAGLPLTTACDVYALGVVLYELLCGERPYELKNDTAAQLEQAILDAEPRAPSRRALGDAIAKARGTTTKALHKSLANDLDAIVLHALAKKPAQRFASVEALRADLDRWLTGLPVEARAPSSAYRIGKFVQRHTLAVTMSAGAVLSLAGVATVAVLMGLQARQESARATAARNFMMGMFKQADTDKSRGADITARELLDRGRDDVMRRLSDRPELQADLLEGIAGIQADMQEFTKADVTFDQLAKVHLAMKQPGQAAMAMAARADNALQMGNYELAQKLVDAARETSGNRRDDPALNAVVTLTEGWLSLRRGDAARAKSLFVETSVRAAAAGESQRETGLQSLVGLIEATRRLYDFDAALAAQGELDGIVAKSPATTPRDRVVLDIGRAELLSAAGRYREALDHDVIATSRCAATLGPNDTTCRRMLYSKVWVLLRLELIRKGSADLGGLEQVATDPSSPDAQAAALIPLLRSYSMLGKLADHPAFLEQARVLAKSGDEIAVAPVRKLQALLFLAEYELRAGKSLEAQRWLDEVSTRQRAGVFVPPELAALAQTLAGISSFTQGHFGDALNNFDEAHVGLERTLGAHHTVTLLYGGNQAIALMQLGRIDDARRILDRSDEPLRIALGASSPAYHRLALLRSRVGETVDHSNVADGKGGRAKPVLSVDDFFI